MGWSLLLHGGLVTGAFFLPVLSVALMRGRLADPPALTVSLARERPQRQPLLPPEPEREVLEAPREEFLEEPEVATIAVLPAPPQEPEEPLRRWLDPDGLRFPAVPLDLVLRPRPAREEQPVPLVLKPTPAPAPQPSAESAESAESPEPPGVAHDTWPEPLPEHSAKPSYPRRALDMNIQGAVICRVTVGADGRVLSVSVEESSGYPVLDQAAVRGLRRWRFKPGTRAGEPVQMDVLKRLLFTFES